MKAKPEQKSVQHLVELHQEGMLKANPEYQRGIVWSLTQRRKLIDSVLRGYPLPLIYLHHIKRDVAGMRRDDLEIIDGQQRINALADFAQGAFKLFDPMKDEKVAKFPAFIRDQECSWAGRDFESLEPSDRARFLETPLTVVLVDTPNSNEVRDLFVRLQSGLPLNSQETRDAWPGEFTDFILRLGGKPELARYPGHEFFTRTLGMRPSTDRGKTRQLAAQIAVLFMSRRVRPEFFTDINSEAINDFYYSHLDFDAQTPDAQRLRQILDKLCQLLPAGRHAKLRGHDAIHLVLLVDSLWDDYAPSWADKLPEALDVFMHRLAEGKATKDGSAPDQYWLQYGQWTRVNSDRGERIEHRHKFYVEKMLELMAPLALKDSKRIYGELDRTILFHRQKKQCLECNGNLDFRSAEIHHVEEHSQGGQTTLDNGAMVHRECHPKGATATKAFAAKFAAIRAERAELETLLESL